MKVATFNANSIRARQSIVLDWLAENEPDVLAIQETKVADPVFPVADFEDAGWHVEIHGQKSYNGLAFVTRTPIARVRRGFDDPLMPEDCRIMTGEFEGITFVNTYVPNGNAVGSDKFAYKLAWLARLRRFFELNVRTDEPLLWLGDINIAPTPDDVFDSPKHLGGIGHHPLEFEALARVVDWGFVDLFRKHTSGPGHYTYWDFFIPRAVERNLGWRIDHIYGTESVAARCTSCVVDVEPRCLERPSDHTFVVAEIE